MNKYAIVIHGGAGKISRKRIEADSDKYKKVLLKALKVGFNVLKSNGSSIDAVAQAIVVLENSSLYNAGKGAVFTSNGENEHDASIMDGSNLRAGAVGCSKYVKNPILLAKEILFNSSHLMLVAKGAYDFAVEKGLKIMPESYFYTEERYQQLLKAKRKNKLILDHEEDDDDDDDDEKYGTVGAVALDMMGSLAAGTSTGGIVNKLHGRVGDSAIIGCGTYANNNTCAISCTGQGEYFIRNTVAHEVSSKIKYKKASLKKATDSIIYDLLESVGAKGGLIGINKNMDIVMPFNTKGMFRGYMTSIDEAFTSIF